MSINTQKNYQTTKISSSDSTKSTNQNLNNMETSLINSNLTPFTAQGTFFEVNTA